ncbi:unnamed protein product [Agarophyton chilense]
MASRLIAQILLMGGTYVARAFVQAYQQALVNSARSGGTSASASRAALRGRMSADEASKILGVSRNAGLKEIHGRYDRLFHANDTSKGGSMYLQAKIHFAKVEMERLALERGERLPEEDNKHSDGCGRNDPDSGESR